MENEMEYKMFTEFLKYYIQEYKKMFGVEKTIFALKVNLIEIEENREEKND